MHFSIAFLSILNLKLINVKYIKINRTSKELIDYYCIYSRLQIIEIYIKNELIEQLITITHQCKIDKKSEKW